MNEVPPDVVAVVVAAQSPLGQVLASVEQCTTHLPADPQATCSWCRKPWPCAQYIAAARAAKTAGVPATLFTPEPLHALLPREAIAQPQQALTDRTTPYGFPPVRQAPRPPS